MMATIAIRFRNCGDRNRLVAGSGARLTGNSIGSLLSPASRISSGAADPLIGSGCEVSADAGAAVGMLAARDPGGAEIRVDLVVEGSLRRSSHSQLALSLHQGLDGFLVRPES
jgi:hypothetical protein